MWPRAFLIVSFLTILIATVCVSALAAPAEKPASPGFAVVELFTSEGCSSCPSADAALADLIQDTKGQRVYALAFHVDYWDNLGWADPFSDAAYTARQMKCDAILKVDRVYTPQAIVNGRTEFVGSRRDDLKKAVASGLAATSKATLAATGKMDGAQLQFAITGTGLAGGTLVNVAVVEKDLSTVVPRGENGGHTLKHENVVRAFKSGQLSNQGHATVSLALPKGVKPEAASVIVYAQRPADLQTLAAVEIALPN